MLISICMSAYRMARGRWNQEAAQQKWRHMCSIQIAVRCEQKESHSSGDSNYIDRVAQK